jgi:NDP-sugar pyrophosphorylase family protein
MTLGRDNATCLHSTDVLILAGGLGTRLRPTVPDLPKVLAPVAGRPYLHHLLRWMERFGAKHIVLGLGYRSDAVHRFLTENAFPDLKIMTIVEPEPLGTAGAVRFARHALATDPVLVLNGDSFVDADLCALLVRHRASGALGTLLCVEVDDAARYGRVELDPAGRITGFREKSAERGVRAMINAGVYVLSARLLDEIAGGNTRSLEHDIFEQLPPGSLAALTGTYPFVDIGTPESLASADRIFDPDT